VLSHHCSGSIIESQSDIDADRKHTEVGFHSDNVYVSRFGGLIGFEPSEIPIALNAEIEFWDKASDESWKWNYLFETIIRKAWGIIPDPSANKWRKLPACAAKNASWKLTPR